MVDEQESPIGWLLMLHDITEIKRTTEQYRLVAEYTADVIYRLSIKEQRYTYVSPSAERLFGYTEKEALTLTPQDILTPDSYEKQSRQLMEDIQNGNNLRIFQLEAIHKDGHIFPVEVHGSLIRGKNGEPLEIVGVARDITERKKMEEQLIVQDRLASIGQLTSGIAMELNNPLTGIISFTSLLLKRDWPEDVKLDLESILEEARRTARTVKNLLAFSRRQPHEKVLIDVNEDIRKVLELREYEQRINNIRVEARLAADLPEILANSSDIQQVFFNIIVNAEYFMIKAHGKGTLVITTERVEEFVRVKFTDDGPGISAENLKHLFTPFYTTKEAGKGMGLSLSIGYGIISDHDGRIWAESPAEKGTTFIIELPIYKEPPNGDNK
ncbi:MAG: two-component system sensor histidine kinase NtrB [Dehalococcoidales bacterium]